MTTKSTSRKGSNAQANLLYQTNLTCIFNLLLARWKENMTTCDSDLNRLSDLSEDVEARDVLRNLRMSNITYWDKADHHDYIERYLETNLPSTCGDMLYLAAQVALTLPQMSKADASDIGRAMLVVDTILHQSPVKATPYKAMLCDADGCCRTAVSTITAGSTTVHYCAKHTRMLYPSIRIAHPAILGAYHD